MKMMNVEKMTPNRSKTYLLPLLSEFYSFPDSIQHLLKNTYIFDEENLYKNCIYLLFKYDVNNPDFMKFEYELSKSDGFVKHYDLENDLVLFVIEFPKEYLEEYLLFIDGRYSRFKVDAQNLIIRYLNAAQVNAYVVNKIQQIFERDVKLRSHIEKRIGQKLPPESELGEIMEKEDETININKNIINRYDAKI